MDRSRYIDFETHQPEVGDQVNDLYIYLRAHPIGQQLLGMLLSESQNEWRFFTSDPRRFDLVALFGETVAAKHFKTVGFVSATNISEVDPKTKFPYRRRDSALL